MLSLILDIWGFIVGKNKLLKIKKKISMREEWEWCNIKVKVKVGEWYLIL